MPTLPSHCVPEEVEVEDGLVAVGGGRTEKCLADEPTQPSCTPGQETEEKHIEQSNE